MRDVALVTCRQMPEPDPDQDLMLEALAGRGLSAGLAAWNDPDVDWSRSRVAVVRSTWDYYHDRDGFVRWAERAGAATRLFNPAPVLAWNSDKIYLGELAARGLSVVPTVFVERGERRDLGATMDERGWTKVVVKPRISAGSFETYAFERGALRGGELEARAAERPVMVQPYVRSVDGHGERSLIWIDGELTHSIRKTPRFVGASESVSAALPIDDAERAFAARVAEVVGFAERGLLYARVDAARDEEGRPMLMELEVVEPSLFLAQSPAALARFAAAVERRVKVA